MKTILTFLACAIGVNQPVKHCTNYRVNEIDKTVVALSADGSTAISFRVQINATGAAEVYRNVSDSTAGIENKFSYVGSVDALQINDDNDLDVWLPDEMPGVHYYLLHFTENAQIPSIVNIGGSGGSDGDPDGSVICDCGASGEEASPAQDCDAVSQQAGDVLNVTCVVKENCNKCKKPRYVPAGGSALGNGMENVLIIRASSIHLNF